VPLHHDHGPVVGLDDSTEVEACRSEAMTVARVLVGGELLDVAETTVKCVARGARH